MNIQIKGTFYRIVTLAGRDDQVNHFTAFQQLIRHPVRPLFVFAGVILSIIFEHYKDVDIRIGVLIATRLGAEEDDLAQVFTVAGKEGFLEFF